MSTTPSYRQPPRAAEHFTLIRQRLSEIRGENVTAKITPTNLPETIERGVPWWPEQVITDGADHFAFRSGSDA